MKIAATLIATFALVAAPTAGASPTLTSPASGARLPSAVIDNLGNVIDQVAATLKIAGSGTTAGTNFVVADQPTVSARGRLTRPYCDSSYTGPGAAGCFSALSGDSDYIQLYDDIEGSSSTVHSFSVPAALMQPFPVSYAVATFDRALLRLKESAQYADDVALRCARKPRTKTSFTCSTSYTLGDTSFRHTARVAYAVGAGKVASKVASVTTRYVDEYCQVTGGSNCVSTKTDVYREFIRGGRYIYAIRRG